VFTVYYHTMQVNGVQQHRTPLTFNLHGQKTFFKIYSFEFHQRKKDIQAWNDMGVSKWQNFNCLNYRFNCSQIELLLKSAFMAKTVWICLQVDKKQTLW